MALREKIKFSIPCEIVIENGKFRKVLLECNDWGDFALQSLPDLTDEEFAMIETKCGIHGHRKIEWDWM